MKEALSDQSVLGDLMKEALSDQSVLGDNCWQIVHRPRALARPIGDPSGGHPRAIRGSSEGHPRAIRGVIRGPSEGDRSLTSLSTFRCDRFTLTGRGSSRS